MIRTLALMISAIVLTTPAAGRTWKSANGKYSFEGDAVAFNDSTVIIKRARAERLVVVEVADLSSEDQAFVAEKRQEMAETESTSEDGWQTWTSSKGWQIRGKVLAFGRRDLVIERTRGVVTINGKAFSALDALHQKLLLAVLTKLENKEFENATDLSRWVMTLGGQPKSYTLEGVLMQLEGGETLPIPFFLFSENDLKALQPGWEAWKASADDEAKQAQQDFLVRQEAMYYQQAREREARHEQMEVLKLNLLGAATGLTQIWEVALIPGPGVWGRPTTVIVSARDSLTATRIALQHHPGYVAGPVRKVAG